MSKINDLNLDNWKQYDDIKTDSLWIIDKRDNSQGHNGDYHGNFIPQIPRQLMKRFTKEGDVVLDPFVGSGTTLIECGNLGRNGIGIELSEEVVEIAKENLGQQNLFQKDVKINLIKGDSTSEEAREKVDEVLQEQDKDNVQLLIMHPPYHDIINFSDHPKGLSNANTLEDFLELFDGVVDNFADLLEKERYMGVVIGDKYERGEWIPLGFRVMDRVLNKKNFKLKSILVKNMTGNRAKRNQKSLWRYRALKGNFYVFRHEYIFLFQKE